MPSAASEVAVSGAGLGVSRGATSRNAAWRSGSSGGLPSEAVVPGDPDGKPDQGGRGSVTPGF